MQTRLREIYLNALRCSPFIGALMLRIYHRKALDTVVKNIRGKNNKIEYSNAILSAVRFDIIGDGTEIVIKDGSVLNDVTFHIRGNNHKILIGRNCRFDRGGNIWFEDRDCSLTIGEDSTFEDVHLVLTEPGTQMRIGRDCMFAYDIDVRTGDSHSILVQGSNERINYARDILIANHVWIAPHCILLKGASVPEDSIVATGSVVTRRFEPKGIIIGGNPAKILKEGITWSRNRVYRTN